MGRGCRMRKGKLGNREKGIRLTLFPFKEAEPGRKATAGRRREGHCQGLLWGGGQGQGGERWPGSQADTERSSDFLQVLNWQAGWMQVNL